MNTINEDRKTGKELSKDALVSAIHSAIDADNATVNKWKKAGEAVRKWYPAGYDSWLGEKAALIKDVIVPALPVETQTALLRTLPRKGTDDAKIYTGGESMLEKHQADKIRARAYADSMYRKVTHYAFEQEREDAKSKGKGKGKGKGEGEGEGEITVDNNASNKTKLMADCSNWVKRLQKSEGEDFDINATIAALNAVIAVLTK